MRRKITLLKAGFIISALLFSNLLFAQNELTGTVKDESGKPLVGVTIFVRGTKTATASDANGNFKISVPKNHPVLVLSSVGYEPQEISVNDLSEIAITMRASVSTLNTVVVTGYGTQKKKDISGSVAIVDVSDAKKIPATTTEQLLQGQASGVTVLNSGQPGGASTVFIRGISNFGQTHPLYVVDGVQVGDMSNLNPNDIESISILKDAGAAAIYGISGGNGVVVITTKKGRAGKATISYDGYIGTQRPLSGNVWHIMSPAQQSEVAFRANDVGTEVLYPDGAGKVPTYGYNTNGPAGGSFGTSGVTSDDGILQYYKFDASNPGNDFLIQKFATGQGTDWFHSIFKPALEQQHTLSASGGSDKSTYFFSANYVDQQGTMLNTYEKRYAIRMNTTFSVKNHIRFGENAFVTFKDNNGGYNGNQQQEGGSIAYTYREMPVIPVFDVAGNYGGGFDGPKGEPLGNGSNPYAIQARSKNDKAHFVLVQGDVFAEADILKDFTVHSGFGFNLFNQYFWYYGFNTYENYESHASPNSFDEEEEYYLNYNWSNTVTYKHSFGKHNVQVLGGFEVKQSGGRYFHASAQNFFSMDPNYVQLQFGTPVNAPYDGIAQPTAAESFFGRLDYTYNDRYILGATVRRDGYSIFYPGHQWGTFPSVSLAWRVTQEDFMKNITWLDELKLRGSYGEAGNNLNISGNNAYNAYGSGFGTSYYGIAGNPSVVTQGFNQTQIGNQRTTWETDKITNVGLDATLFNHLDITAEWYKKTISGLLFSAQASALVGGANLPAVNIGDVQNTGVDISATYRNRISRDFSFSIGTNITTYKSKITYEPSPGYFDFGYNRDLDIVRNQVGHPIGAFYGYKVIGIYQSNADAAKGATYSGAAAGSWIYQDTNGDGKIDANDRTWIGNPNPKFTYGVNLSANYKNFDLTMFLYGSYGNDDYNYVKYWTCFYSTFQGGKNIDLYNKAAIVQNGVVTNPGATLTAANIAQPLGSSATSSFYVENGSFLKCRVAQIGYTINPSILNHVGINKVHIYVQATNLFTITKYSGLDPELIPSISNNGTSDRQSAAFGIDYGAYPTNQKQFIFGANLTF